MATAYARADSPYWWYRLRDPDGKRLLKRSIYRQAERAKGYVDQMAKDLEDALARHSRDKDGEAATMLIKHGIITAEQAAQSLGDGEAPSYIRELTIEEAANSHDSTAYDIAHAPTEYRRHLRDLRLFLEWSPTNFLARDLTRELVRRYVAHLQRTIASPDTIRHRLLYLRRAASYAHAQLGYGNPFADLRIRHRANAAPVRRVKAYSAKAAVAILRALEAAGDLKGAVALGLQCLCGLRPSEVSRLTVGDYRDGVLAVGVSQRKNASSRRDIPVPATLAAWMDKLAADPTPTRKYRLEVQRPRRPAKEPLIVSRRRDGTGKGHYEKTAFSKYCKDLLTAHGGHLSTKALRKTFASAAAYKVDLRLFEIYMGHKPEGLSAVTWQHYMETTPAQVLQPVADAMEAVLTAGVEPERLPRKRPKCLRFLIRKRIER
jgi:site-specific recombinase XerD